MANIQYFVATLCVLMLFLEKGHAISCYVCNSYTDTRCLQEKLPEEFKVKCPDMTPEGNTYKMCRKIKQVIDFEVNGLPPDSRIIRSCGWDDSSYKNRCYQRSGFGGRQEVCACETDDCNGASGLYTSVFLTTTLLVLLKIVM